MNNIRRKLQHALRISKDSSAFSWEAFIEAILEMRPEDVEPEWEPFERAFYSPADIESTLNHLRQEFNEEVARKVLRDLDRSVVWKNNLYEVALREDPPPAEGWPNRLHLSIKRLDKAYVRDWRHLQRIKNEIVGPEHEMVELLPAESRLVDTANQFHLWGFADPTYRFPFGFTAGRFVGGPEIAKVIIPGATQRPLEADESVGGSV